MNKLINYIAILIICSAISSVAQSSFSSERLKKSLVEYVQSKTNPNATIEIISNIKDTKFNQSKVKAKFQDLNLNNNGISSINISFFENDKKIESTDVKFKVKEMKKIWVTARTLSRNTVVEEEDLVESTIDVAGIDEADLLEKSEIVGSKLNRTMQKNSPITKENLAENNLIKSGDKVNIIVQSGAITIRSTGSALQDGSAGQNLRVKRDGKTAQVLQGKVMSDGSVFIGLK